MWFSAYVIEKQDTNLFHYFQNYPKYQKMFGLLKNDGNEISLYKMGEYNCQTWEFNSKRGMVSLIPALLKALESWSDTYVCIKSNENISFTGTDLIDDCEFINSYSYTEIE